MKNTRKKRGESKSETDWLDVVLRVIKAVADELSKKK